MKKSLTESGLRSKGIDMRDKIKDIEYFNTFINEDLARVKKFSDTKNEFLNSTAQWGDGIHSRTVDIYSFI